MHTYTTNQLVYSVGPYGHDTKYTLWLEISELASKISYGEEVKLTNEEQDDDLRPLFESTSWTRVFRDTTSTRHHWRHFNNSKPKIHK